MTVPRSKPAPVNDEAFNNAIEQLRELVVRIDQTEAALGELLSKRDQMIVGVLTRYEISQKRLGEMIGIGRQNVGRILIESRKSVDAKPSGSRRHTAAASQTLKGRRGR